MKLVKEEKEMGKEKVLDLNDFFSPKHLEMFIDYKQCCHKYDHFYLFLKKMFDLFDYPKIPSNLLIDFINFHNVLITEKLIMAFSNTLLLVYYVLYSCE